MARADCSPEFRSLLMGLMHKDPYQRLNWAEVCSHPLWEVPLEYLPLPPEPKWERQRSRRKSGNQNLDPNHGVRPDAKALQDRCKLDDYTHCQLRMYKMLVKCFSKASAENKPKASRLCYHCPEKRLLLYGGHSLGCCYWDVILSPFLQLLVLKQERLMLESGLAAI